MQYQKGNPWVDFENAVSEEEPMGIFHQLFFWLSESSGQVLPDRLFSPTHQDLQGHQNIKDNKQERDFTNYINL